jgi:hypothetical protein
MSLLIQAAEKLTKLSPMAWRSGVDAQPPWRLGVISGPADRKIKAREDFVTFPQSVEELVKLCGRARIFESQLAASTTPVAAAMTLPAAVRGCCAEAPAAIERRCGFRAVLAQGQ